MALAPTPQPYLFTIEEYLAFERASDERHEYLDGVIYAMAWESPNRSTICVNLTASLVPQLRGSPCRVFSKDTKVLFGPMPRIRGSRQGLFAYPDLVVVCGTMQFHDAAQDVLLNPTVIIEVLSPSTEAFDRVEKFHRYRRWLLTLTDYVLVAQHQPAMDHYHRTAANRWELVAYEGLEARLELEAIGCTVPLVEVYERVEFATSKEEAS